MLQLARRILQLPSPSPVSCLPFPHSCPFVAKLLCFPPSRLPVFSYPCPSVSIRVHPWPIFGLTVLWGFRRATGAESRAAFSTGRQATSSRRRRPSGSLVCAQELIPGNASLRQYGSQSGSLNSRVVRHGQTIRPSLAARTPHRDVLGLAHHLEPQCAQRGNHSPFWSIDGKLRHQAGIVASATNASRSGESSGATSLPKVSMWNRMADFTSARASS